MPPPNVSPLPLCAYTRLQRWRRRQQATWPGLFPLSLSSPSPSNALHTMTIQHLPSYSTVQIDDAQVLFCDGCGALIPCTDTHDSSDTTLPPSCSQDADMLRCPTCRFITPTGPLRRLLHLPPCGPHFPPTIALALLVEGLGPALSLKRHGAGKQAWFLDSLCRREGLDALLSAIGAHEEQLHAVNVTFPSPQAQQLASRRQFMFDAERFLNTTIPHNILPGIPFSVADVCDLPIVEQSGTAAAERAASIVLEAGRIWRNELRSARNMKALTKIQVLAQQFKREQTKARIYNHSYLTVLENIQITQIHRPSQPSSDKNS